MFLHVRDPAIVISKFRGHAQCTRMHAHMHTIASHDATCISKCMICIVCIYIAPTGDGDLQFVQVATVPLSSINLTYFCGLHDCALPCENDDTVWPGEVARIAVIYIRTYMYM